MTDEKQNEKNNDLARRDFVALSVAAGITAAAAGSALAKDLEVVETMVEVKTPDGTADAAFIHPVSGSHPGVLVWTDAFGLRPSMRAIGKRIAAQGYSVLVPNPFYRVAKDPFDDASTFSFANKDDMAKLQKLMGSVNAAGNPEKDAAAYVAFLDEQKQVNKKKKIGTQGYCMGGPLVVRTAASLPDRIGAGGSFHGGGLVTDKPDSPHLLASKIKAHMYFGIATSDDVAADALQLKIEDQAAVLIATQQPVARDLRELVTVLKVTDNLERAGDHAVHLAKAAIRLSGEPPFRQVDRLCRMAETGCEMIRGAVDAYLNQDAQAARNVAARDDEVDDERRKTVQEILELMREGPTRSSAPPESSFPRASSSDWATT